MTDLNAVGFALEELFALRLQALSGRWPRMCAHRGLKGKMTQRDKEIAERLALVKGTLSQVCTRTQSSVELVAVSKTFPAEAVFAAVMPDRAFSARTMPRKDVPKSTGSKKTIPNENSCGTSSDRFRPTKPDRWPNAFDWVDSVDRLRIAKRLNDQRPEVCRPLMFSLKSTSVPRRAKAALCPRSSKPWQAKSPSCLDSNCAG